MGLLTRMATERGALCVWMKIWRRFWNSNRWGGCQVLPNDHACCWLASEVTALLLLGHCRPRHIECTFVALIR